LATGCWAIAKTLKSSEKVMAVEATAAARRTFRGVVLMIRLLVVGGSAVSMAVLWPSPPDSVL
jgi:hypothetical protein